MITDANTAFKLDIRLMSTTFRSSVAAKGNIKRIEALI